MCVLDKRCCDEPVLVDHRRWLCRRRHAFLFSFCGACMGIQIAVITVAVKDRQMSRSITWVDTSMFGC